MSDDDSDIKAYEEAYKAGIVEGENKALNIIAALLKVGRQNLQEI